MQDQDLSNRAQSVSNQFQMSYDKALALTKLADKVQAMSAQEQMSVDDRDAIVNSAMGIAGISEDEVDAAIAQTVQSNDQKAINDLMEKAATNLGMPSSAGLRDQILPRLGIQL